MKLNVQLDPDVYDAVAIKTRQDDITIPKLIRLLFRLHLGF